MTPCAQGLNSVGSPCALRVKTNLAPAEVQTRDILGRGEDNARVGIPIYNQSCSLLQGSQHLLSTVNTETSAPVLHFLKT